MPSGSGGVLGGTFHSVAHRFVRLHAASLGLAPGFAVLDAGDAADLIDLIREEHGHAQSKVRFPKKSTLLDIYSRTVNFQRPLSEVVDEAFPWCEQHVEPMAALFKAYTARKRALGVLDLDDLLLYWRALAADELRRRVDRLRLRPRPDRRVPGRQRSPGRDRPRPASQLPRGDRGRRRSPGDLRLALGLGRAHPRVPQPLPRGRGADPRAQLPLDPADPRHRQRRGRAGHPLLREAATRRPRRRHPARARLLPRRVGAGDRGVRAGPRSPGAGHGAAPPGRADADLARQRPARARARAPRRSRSSSTAGSGTSRPRTSRT